MDKITISKKQFERWMASTDKSSNDFGWQSLVAESQRPELIERYIVEQPNCYQFMSCFEELKAAEDAAKLSGGKVIKLREVVGV